MVDSTVRFPWRWTLWDLVIATVVATVAVEYRTQSVADTLVGLAMAVALVFRRHAPARVMAAVSALALLQWLVCPDLAASYDVAVLVAMVAVVTHGGELWHGYVAGAVMMTGVAFVAAAEVLAVPTDLGTFTILLVSCAAVWLVAYALRSNREKALVLADRAATAERERDHIARLALVEQRTVIARELHDVVAHSLAVMIVQADGASYAIDQDTEQARAAIRTIADTGRDALADMHHIVALLRGDGAVEGDPDRKVGLGQLETLVERARAAGLAVDLRMEGEPRGLSSADELTIVRLAQEALTNSLRHAGPGATVTVTVRFAGGTAAVEVVDDGAGRAAALGASGGNGLVGMRERVSLHGGEFTAGPLLGYGWQVRAVIPIKAVT